MEIEADESFKQAGVIPFRWEIRPGVPKLQHSQLPLIKHDDPHVAAENNRSGQFQKPHVGLNLHRRLISISNNQLRSPEPDPSGQLHGHDQIGMF